MRDLKPKTFVLSLGLLFIVAFSSAVAGQVSRYLAGELLVATADKSDPRFDETVIYMVQHNEEGAMGLVINRPMGKLKIQGAENEGASGEIVLHYGGPVELGKGFVLHTDEYQTHSTTSFGDGLSLTANIKILHDISEGKGPRRSLVTLGYAGWAPGQLEAEIQRGGWFTIPADPELIFGEDWKTKWQRARDRRTINI